MSENKHAAIREAMEAYIDAEGLSDLLAELASVCFEKAAHVRENWQDKALARAWTSMGDRVLRVSRDATTRLP